MNELFDRYARSVEKCVEMAQAEIHNLVDGIDASHKKAARDALLAEVPRIVDRYSRLAAAAAAEYYEKNRAAQIGGRYRAKLGSAEPSESIESSVRFACGHLFTKEADDGR